jgi:hypothetical protein
MARPESGQRPWDITGSSSEVPKSSHEIQQSAMELGDFLSHSPIDLVRIESVLPSAKLGTMYSIYVGRVMENAGDNGENIAILHRTNSVSVELLKHSLELMSKRKRRKHKAVLKNLKIIEIIVGNAFNWGDPFNARADN